MRQRALIIFGVAVSLALLAYTLRDVSVAELLEHLGHANLWLLLAATAAATLTFALRAIRWRILLLPVAGELSFRSRFATVCIGFMANNVVGARVGEFARGYSLTRIEPVGLSPVIASLVVERLLDGIVTVGLLIPAYLVIGPERLASAGPLVEILTGFLIIVGIGIVVASAMVWLPGRLLALADKLTTRLPEKFTERLIGVLESFIDGLGVLRKWRILVAAFLWSVVVWVWNAFSFYLGLLAFDIVEPGFTGSMLLQSIISLFVAIPSTPGFFGPFEFGARVCLELYGIDPSLIVSFAASYHILTFLPVTLIGIWYMRALGIKRSDITNRGEAAES
ncbi:MAG: flippase-like domain-containing protein [Gemmatimonadota bacterium]|nr:flippase-like domain-containing protein [Gemmatimonadota bacterium]